VDDATTTLLILAGAVVLFVWDRLPVGVVALGAALALYATGIIDVQQTFAGFGDPTVIFIASLFVVAEALDATGVTTYAGQRLFRVAGDSQMRLLASLLLLVAVLSALITVNGAVAALLPMTVVVALRMRRAASKLLLPLAFTAHAGSMLALTGTPVNVLISQAAAEAGVGRFGYFEFTLVGVPLVIGAAAISLLLGPRLLPDREAKSIPPDLGRHARTLVEHYSLDPELLARHAVPRGLYTSASGVAELLVHPRSELIGDNVFPGMVTESGDLIVLAVQRGGEDLGPEPVQLAAGDTLLVEGSWPALEENIDDREVLVVDQPEDVRRQVVPLGTGARRALGVTGTMIVLLASGAVPAAIAGLLAAMSMVALRVLRSEHAYRAIAWSTVVLVAGMIPVSNAIKDTGAAKEIADALVDLLGGAGPTALLAGLFVITVLFGQAISNTATALIVIPIAVSAAAGLHVSARPLLMGVAVAAAASFLTPIATPANMMVMGPGGYRFSDYWRFGLPMLALFALVGILLVPAIWSF
jgi:di/tricarboxylate transporter